MQDVSIGVRPARAPRIVGSVLGSLLAAAVAGGLGATLVPLGMGLGWLAALCAVVFVLWLGIALRRAVVSVTALELQLAREPRHIVLRGPWVNRSHPPHEVAAIQVWCDCGDTRPALDPHRDGMEVLLRNGISTRVAPGVAFAPDVAALLREKLAPAGIRVVDWGGTHADR